jgi:hypothetical protein
VKAAKNKNRVTKDRGMKIFLLSVKFESGKIERNRKTSKLSIAPFAIINLPKKRRVE